MRIITEESTSFLPILRGSGDVLILELPRQWGQLWRTQQTKPYLPRGQTVEGKGLEFVQDASLQVSYLIPGGFIGIRMSRHDIPGKRLKYRGDFFIDLTGVDLASAARRRFPPYLALTLNPSQDGRGTLNPAPLLPFGEKGLGDEGLGLVRLMPQSTRGSALQNLV